MSPRHLLGRLLGRFVSISYQNPRSTLFIAVGVTLIAAVIASRLSVDPRIEGLIPKDRPVVQDYVATEIDFAHTNYIIVTVEVPSDLPYVRYRDFISLYKKRLGLLPQVQEEKLKLTREFFSHIRRYYFKHGLILTGEDTIQKLDTRLASVFSNETIKESSPYRKHLWKSRVDPLNLYELIQETLPLAQRVIVDQSGEFFVTADHGLLFFVLSAGDAWIWDRTQDLVKQARIIEEEVWQEILPQMQRYFPDDHIERPVIHWMGKHMNILGTAHAIWRTFKTTVLVSALCIALVFLIVFRNFKALFFAYIPVFIGFTWTFAIAQLSVGTLNALTIITGSVLIGLGIDFPIYLLNSYYQKRAEGITIHASLMQSWENAGQRVVWGALTTCIAFGVLMASDLPAYRQIGYLSCIGLLSILFAVLIVLPALIRLWDTSDAMPRILQYPKILTELPLKRVRTCILLALIVFLPLITFTSRFQLESPFQEAYILLREPAQIASTADQKLAQLLNSSLYPSRLIVEADNWEGALRKNDRLAHLLRQYEAAGSIAFFDSLHQWLPSQKLQAERYEVLLKQPHLNRKTFRAHYLEYIRQYGKSYQRDLRAYGKQVSDLLAARDPMTPESMKEAELGSLLDLYVAEYNGTIRVSSYIYLPNTYYPNAKEQLISELKREEVFSADHVLYSSEESVIAEIRNIITGELWWMGLTVLGVMASIFLATFRSVSLAFVSLLPMLLGGAAAIGAYGIWKGAFSIFTIPWIPVYIGLAADDALHIGAGVKDGRRHIADSLKRVGIMIVLSSVTTLIGFGSLALADIQFLQQIGTWIAIAMACELVASLILLPALLGRFFNRT